MSHHTNHRHSHTQHLPLKPILWALGLNTAFLIIELIGAIWTNSLALLADVGHMVTDIFALSIVLVAAHFSRRPKTTRHTYGFLRSEVIGAFLNGILLLILCGYLIFESFHRLTTVQAVNPTGIIILGFAGIIVNGSSALILYPSSRRNLNVRGAFLHLLSDVLGSAGALVGGIIIYYTEWYPADTLISLFIAALILRNTIPLIKESLQILLEATPGDIDIQNIENDLLALPYVADIHDLHVWVLNHNQYLLSCHLCLNQEYQTIDHWEQCLCEAEELVEKRYGIQHCTLQVEPLHYKDTPKPEC